MNHHHFLGRKKELSQLKAVYEKKTKNIIITKGRRRVGKSRLLTEFAMHYGKGGFFTFTALAPEKGMTAQMQRDHFGRQLKKLAHTKHAACAACA